MKRHITFLTGAGISVGSVLITFRGNGGLWTSEEFQYLASTACLYKKTQKCLDFYNMRRSKLAEVEPNEAHYLIAALEKDYDVTVVTQNVDDLHERAGSTNVIHIHGELTKVCSIKDRTTCIERYPLTKPIHVGDKAKDGAQLRPYVVMFGEDIDNKDIAVNEIKNADIFVIVGTSLQVYPAAAFIHCVKFLTPKYLIDTNDIEQCERFGFTHFKTSAIDGMKMLINILRNLKH